MVVLRFWYPLQHCKYHQVSYTTLLNVANRSFCYHFKMYCSKLLNYNQTYSNIPTMYKKKCFREDILYFHEALSGMSQIINFKF